MYVLSFLLNPAGNIISPIASSYGGLSPITSEKSTKEVFGFAPYWTFNKLQNVDFDVLTTFAYFGIPVGSDGNLDLTGPGYQTFKSNDATQIFTKAHDHGTRVVLTLTNMQDDEILALMDDPDAQQRTIDQAVDLVKKRGIDGLNIDFEYSGNPGDEYRAKFSQFIQNITEKMHQEVPSSRVTVSVYASAVKDPKIYDISSISKSSDGIFMMAYDFAVAGSDQAMPTAPLYGHKQGKYWYDVASAVNDFLKVMPADKLILGVPWYGYNYVVDQPKVNAATYPYWSVTQTYSLAQDNITPSDPGYETGWDKYGEVGWKAYQDPYTGAWRMIFLDDAKSLGLKFDFAKDHNLKGVGMWALGFDDGRTDFWKLLSQEFGKKYEDVSIMSKAIADNI